MSSYDVYHGLVVHCLQQECHIWCLLYCTRGDVYLLFYPTTQCSRQGHETGTAAAELGPLKQDEQDQEICDDESEGGIPFEPFDVNDDGRIFKTASQCSRGSWKRPEAGWDVTITVHRFCELSPSKAAPGEDSQAQEHNVEPRFLQLAFRLGEDEDDGFPQVTQSETGCRVLPLFFGAAAAYLGRRRLDIYLV